MLFRSIVPVFNKMDAVADRAAFSERAGRLHPGAVMASAVSAGGLETLKEALRSQARLKRPLLNVRIPLSDGARLAELYRIGEVVSRAQVNGVFELAVRLDAADVQRLRGAGVEVK